MPKRARGKSGSFTRTTSKNIMLISASAVATTRKNKRASRARSKGSGIPAISDPNVINTTPEIIALTTPARQKPRINSNLLIGVTK